MLKLDNICKTFNPGTINEKKALQNLSLTLKPGDFVTVIGGNGAGKSTMLNAIAGVWPVDSGSITIDGINVTGECEHKRAAYIGRVFQDPMLGTAPNMQIEENLALAMRRGRRRGLRWGVTKAEREQYRDRLKGLGLGLEDRMTAKVGLLSGGQRQALTLLMASLQKPKLLLLDEHTAALDPATAKPWHEAHHDERGAYNTRRGGRRKEKADKAAADGKVRRDSGQAGGIRQDTAVVSFCSDRLGGAA